MISIISCHEFSHNPTTACIQFSVITPLFLNPEIRSNTREFRIIIDLD